MTGSPPRAADLVDPRAQMPRWRRWLFNRLAQWEEAALARALGLPAGRVFLVDVSPDEYEGVSQPTTSA